MPKQRQFSDGTVKAVAAHVHHHRQAAQVVDATLRVIMDYMRAEQLGADMSPSEESLGLEIRTLLEHLRNHAMALSTQLASQPGPIADELAEQWGDLQERLTRFIGRTDAAAITTIRGYAIAARRLAGTTLTTNGTARRKDSAKDARAAALELHRLTCVYDLLHAQRLLADTTDGLLVPINILEGKSVSQAVIRPINVPNVVRESIATHTTAALRRGITFKENFLCATAYAAISAPDLFQALGNLFSNAIKYTGELGPNSGWDHTWIKVTVEADSNTIRISVQSWGAPFTPDELKSRSVFNWGTRGHFAWRVAGAEGSGIGLHDAQAVINRAGGQITIDSEAVNRLAPFTNKMTTVTIQLPRMDE